MTAPVEEPEGVDLYEVDAFITNAATFPEIRTTSTTNLPEPKLRSSTKATRKISGSSIVHAWFLETCNLDLHGTGGGDRTRTRFPPGDFKSPASAIPPPRRRCG